MKFILKKNHQLLFLAMSLLLLQSCGINNIPTYDEAAKASFSQVLNQYQRRTDLIPNLVNIVKGYAAHEKETLDSVIRARRQISNTEASPELMKQPDKLEQFEKSQQQLTSALSRLMVVVEQYPNLKANENFLALQSQLEGTENRIAVARRDYIMAVQKYNTELRTFPGRIWAMTLYRNAEPMANFTAPEAVQEVPKIEF